MIISNMNARKYVVDRKPFKASNLYAECVNGVYAVYSYGKHFPLFVYKGGTWYQNADKYSVTTTKHMRQTHPHCPTTLLSTTEMQKLIND